MMGQFPSIGWNDDASNHYIEINFSVPALTKIYAMFCPFCGTE